MTIGPTHLRNGVPYVIYNKTDGTVVTSGYTDTLDDVVVDEGYDMLITPEHGMLTRHNSVLVDVINKEIRLVEPQEPDKTRTLDQEITSALGYVDRRFEYRINNELGPFAVLHALKRLQVQIDGPLIDNDTQEIIAQAAIQDQKLASIDKERREYKARIRKAKSSKEVSDIIKGLDD